MSYASCDCCGNGEDCPHNNWLTIHRWIGPTEIQNNISKISKVWDTLKLGKHKKAVWQWKVVVLGTGNIPNGAVIDLGQNRRPYREWTCPITDLPEKLIYKIEFDGMQWDDSTLKGSVVSGDFRLVFALDGIAIQTDLIQFDATNQEIDDAISATELMAFCESVTVTSGPLPAKEIILTIEKPLTQIVVSGLSSLIGSDPPVAIHTAVDGSAGPPQLDEMQIADYSWPASAGWFRLVVNAKGKIETTEAIPAKATAVEIADALCRLKNLNHKPHATSAPAGIDKQEISIIDKAHASSGKFKLSLTANGSTQTTSWIPVGDSTQVQQALRSLSNVTSTDVIYVRKTTVNNFPLEIEFAGSLTGMSIPLLGIEDDFVGGDVKVTSTGWSLIDHVRHFIQFTGSLSGENVPEMGSVSNLINIPTIKVTQVNPSEVSAFRREFEPLNVGFLWGTFLRNAFGYLPSRNIRQTSRWKTVNPGTYPGQQVIQRLPIGYGVVSWSGCEGTKDQVGINRLASCWNAASAFFDTAKGTLVVSGAFEFALQIRCVGCRYSPEFQLWGAREQQAFSFYRVADGSEKSWSYEEEDESFVCDADKWCRSFLTREENIPYPQRSFYGVDGFDGHLVNDVFFAQGAKKARKPVCNPDVVLLGDGYWTEFNFSRMYDQWICKDSGSIDGKTATPQLTCEVPWKEEFAINHPTSNIDRLKLIYQESFSYWGGWIDWEKSFQKGVFVCCFDRFDISEINVLFLGGLPIGGCPQAVSTFGKVINQTEQDRFSFWKDKVHWDFDIESLHALKKWLDIGEKVLVFDGGHFPYKLLPALGIESSVEMFEGHSSTISQTHATTLNGSLGTRPCWGSEIPDWLTRINPYFEACYCDPVDHIFTQHVSPATTPSGSYWLESDFTYDGKNIAGHPMGTPRATRGLLTVSQKFSWDTLRYNGAIIPTSGLRSYTTAIPKVTPSPTASVLGRVRGSLPVPPWHYSGGYATTQIDYPGIVCENWRGSQFKLRFVWNFSAETIVLEHNATATDIQNALEALPNIGSGLTVSGTELPGDISIEFSTSSTSNSNVPLLEILESDAYEIESIQIGDASQNAIQALRRKKNPSRIIVSCVNELVDQDAWGVNWDSAQLTERELSNGFHVTQSGDNQVGVIGMMIDADDDGSTAPHCRIIPFPSYGVSGYGWGRGLSSIASARFLLNLRDRRKDY